MVRTWTLHPVTAESRFDRAYFFTEHVRSTRALLGPHGLLDVNLEEGVALDAPGPERTYLMMACLTFESLEALEAAMAACGRELAADFANFTEVRPLVQVNRVVSETRAEGGAR